MTMKSQKNSRELISDQEATRKSEVPVQKYWDFINRFFDFSSIWGIFDEHFLSFLLRTVLRPRPGIGTARELPRAMPPVPRGARAMALPHR